MKPLLTILSLTTALGAATVALAVTAPAQCPGSCQLSLSPDATDTPLLRVDSDDDDDWKWFGLRQKHGDDDDEDEDEDDCEDDDDDEGCMTTGGGNAAPAAPSTPPKNGLFGNGQPPQVKSN
ncbi:MAG: hypothetical protein ACK4MS_11850 [Paracoccaceae bacterium]